MLTQGPDNNVLGAGAYRVFRKMPERGHPPDEWSQLLVEARAEVYAWTSARTVLAIR